MHQAVSQRGEVHGHTASESGNGRRTSKTISTRLRSRPKQVIPELQWVGERKEDLNSPPSYQDISAGQDRRRIACGAEEIKGPAARPQTAQSSDVTIEKSKEAWSTYLKVPITPPNRLLPSFCARHTALAYTLIYRVTIVGVHTKRIYLGSPLQVAYPTHEILANGTVAAGGQQPDPVDEPLSTDGEACCVSVASRLDVDHVSSFCQSPVPSHDLED